MTLIDKDEALLPCPFCGGPVGIERGETAHAIVCIAPSTCHDSGLLVGFAPEDEAEAIAAWNTRADPIPAAALAVPDNGFADLIRDAIAEAEKAMRKFPQPNYVISKMAEEAGEVVKAAIHTAEGRETMENLRGEMKQTIAMLYRLWVEGDQVHGLAPVSAALRGEGTP